MLADRADEEHRAHQVDAQDRLPGFGVAVGDGGVVEAGDAGVVDQGVQGAVGGEHLFHQGVDRLFVGDVHGAQGDLGAFGQVGGGFFQAFLVAVHQHQAGAFLGETAGGGAADAAAGTGDQDVALVETLHGGLLGLFVLFLEDDTSWTGGQDFGMLFH